MSSAGILIATDQNLEWLLPWWWSHYREQNDYPVAFGDLGMSPEALAWCKERGICFALPSTELPSFEKETFSPEEQKKWARYFPESIWARRPIWFRKPFVLANTPFERTVWLDIDCMVRRSLEPLFNYLHLGIEIAIGKEREVVQQMELERGFLFPGETSYNSGVIAYRKGASFLGLWIEKIREDHRLFITDQHALSRVLFEYPILRLELSSLYNWSMYEGANEEAVIQHYHGALKMEIDLGQC